MNTPDAENPYDVTVLDTDRLVDLPDLAGVERIIGVSIPTAVELATLLHPTEVTQ